MLRSSVRGSGTRRYLCGGSALIINRSNQGRVYGLSRGGGLTIFVLLVIDLMQGHAQEFSQGGVDQEGIYAGGVR